MSVYIVDTKTIDKIMSFLSWYLNGHDARAYYPTIGEYYNFSLYSPVLRMNKLGTALLEMNTEAVKSVSGNDHSPVVYKYDHCRVTKIEAIKALRCFLSQCDVGDVSASKLFEEMWEIMCGAALDIVEELPEYISAEWG
jgi:hypothetical protein